MAPLSTPLRGPALLAWATGVLSLEFPASFADKAAIAARQSAWRELLEAHPWVTEDVFRLAVYAVRWKHPGPFLPPSAVFLDYCEAAAAEREREARARQRRLPAASPVEASQHGAGWNGRSGPERAAFILRHLAIGKLAARGRPAPTGEEVATVEQEIRVSGFMGRALRRLAAGEAVAPQELLREGTRPDGRRQPGATSRLEGR